MRYRWGRGLRRWYGEENKSQRRNGEQSTKRMY